MADTPYTGTTQTTIDKRKIQTPYTDMDSTGVVGSQDKRDKVAFAPPPHNPTTRDRMSLTSEAHPLSNYGIVGVGERSTNCVGRRRHIVVDDCKTPMSNSTMSFYGREDVGID